MGFGPSKVFTVATLTSGLTLTSEIDLAQSWGQVFLEIPSMTSSTDVNLQAGDASDGNFKRVYSMIDDGSGALAPVLYNIDSAITNCIVPCVAPSRFMKVELGTAMTASVAVFKFYCKD